MTASTPIPTIRGRYTVVGRLPTAGNTDAVGGLGGAILVTDELRGGARLVLKSAPLSDAPELMQELGRHEGLVHPNLGTAVGLVRDPAHGRVYLATPWYAGGDLRRWLLGQPPLEDRVRVFRDILRGVARLHEAGLVHRDLKLENVVLDADGRARVIDLGLALRPSSAPPDGVAGTAATVAPEVLRGDEATAAADAYACGVILYELLTGRFPHGGTVAEQLRRRASGDPPDPIPARPGLPPPANRLPDLAMRLLADTASARPTIVEALQVVAGPGEPIDSLEGVLGRLDEVALIGREHVTERVSQFLADLDQGRSALPPVTWVVSGPGEGRTAVAEAIRRAAHAAGFECPDITPPPEADRLRAWLGLPVPEVHGEIEGADQAAAIVEHTLEVAAELTRATRDVPWVLVVDDGLDAPSVRAFIRAAVRLHSTVTPARLAVVITLCRDEIDWGEIAGLQAELERFSEPVTVELGLLDRRAIAAVCARLSPRHAVPDGFVRAVETNTGGHPALVRLALESVIRAGAAPISTDAPFPEGMPSETEWLPTTLADAARRRVTALEPEGQEAAHALLLAGGRLDEARFRDLLQVACAGDEGVDLALAAGVMGRVVRSAGQADIVLVGQATGRAVSQLFVPAMATALATTVIGWFEAHRRSGDAAVLARLEAARGNLPEAALWAERAGGFDEAARWLSEALARPGETNRRALSRALARVRATLGDFPGAHAALGTLTDGCEEEQLDLVELEIDAGRAKQALETLGDADSRRARALAGRALLLLGEPARALERLDALQDEVSLPAGAESPPDPAWSTVFSALDLHIGLTRYLAALYLGQTEDALAGTKKLAKAVASGDVVYREEPMLLNAVGIIYQRRGEFDQSAMWYEQSLDAARRQNNLPRLGIALMNLGTVAQEMGRFAEALSRYAEAADVARRTGDATALTKALMNEANLLLQSGALDDARARFVTGGRLAARSGSRFFEAYFQLLSADALFRDGKFGAAIQEAQRSRTTFEALGSVREAAECTLLEARAALESRDIAGSESALRDLDAAAARLGSEPHRRWVRLLTAEIERVRPRGNDALAVAILEELARGLSEDVRPDERSRIELALARALAAAGRPADARLHAREAGRLHRIVADRVDPNLRPQFDALPEHRASRETLAFLDVANTEIPHVGSEAAFLAQVLELNSRLAGEPDPDRLVRAILDIAIGATGAERGFILTPNDGDTELMFDVRAARNVERETLKRSSSRYSAGIAEEVLARGRPILSIDAMDDERLRTSQSVAAMRLRSVLCVPMRHKGVPIGVVYVDNRFQRGAFSHAHLAFMEAFADQAALALQSAEALGREHASRVLAEKTGAELAAARAEVERLNAELLIELDRRNADLTATREELEAERSQRGTRFQYDAIVGEGPAMQQLFSVLDRITPTSVSVMITGESGTGKELVARALHYLGPRAKGPFVSVNCAALPEQLLESEFFGAVRGAFTGADRDRAGLFERAHGGTLFLDEIGEMSLPLQAKLLRALETRTIRRVGGSVDIEVDVRLLSATNRDLFARLASGAFREDLLYRLRVIEVRVPSLRERIEDLPLLVAHIGHALEERLKVQSKPLAPDAMYVLARHSWPGNVRELEGVLTQAFLLAPGPALTRADLRIPGARTADNVTPLQGEIEWDGVSNLDQVVRKIVRSAWEKLGRNQSKAADALEINRNTFRAKLGEMPTLGLTDESGALINPIPASRPKLRTPF